MKKAISMFVFLAVLLLMLPVSANHDEKAIAIQQISFTDIKENYINTIPESSIVSVKGELLNQNKVLVEFNGQFGIVNASMLEKDFILVDIDNQQISMYLNGGLLVSGPVVTGTADTERETPRGEFSILYKDYDVTLEGADYKSFVNYWMPIYKGIGIHDADGWRDEYGGDIYETNGSHGCINVPLYIAEIIYENTYAGMMVIVK